MAEHGGRLRTAVKRYGIALEDWLDLSTGINPVGWPVPPPDPRAWNRLPEDDDGLELAAQAYYGCTSLLPVPGSQAAIQLLPRLRSPGRVGILAPTYFEHERCWRQAGHEVVTLAPDQVANRLDRLDVLLLANPNNPTGGRHEPGELLAWHRQLACRGGWLVVDEAFMDATPEASLAPHVGLPGLIVLRSLGKFFGLAGARVGFVLAWPEVLLALKDVLGPWSLAGPAREAARGALWDFPWQQRMINQLPQQSRRLAALLDGFGLRPGGVTSLFVWCCTGGALELHEALACQGILSRLFLEPISLRFGLPGTETDWLRLERALAGVRGRVQRG